jgi:MoaA/NifB/PqqE/SkfB family radical SAM enzyme
MSVYRIPPKLVGYNFGFDEVKRARDANRLLALRVETSMACNLDCIYCNGNSGAPGPNEISFATLTRIVGEAKELGAKSVVIIGGGEPTIYPRFPDLIHCVDGLGMIPVVISNGLHFSPDTVRFLFEHNASVLIKLDSLDQSVQDTLAGCSGAYAKIRRGLENLLAVYSDSTHDGCLRVGISFVVTALNYSGIEDIWKFCRENNLYPNAEDFIPRGRGRQNVDMLTVSPEKGYQLKQRLLLFDRETYAYDWLVHSPLACHGCLQTMYGAYLSCEGFVRPCADIDIREFNVEQMRLADIIKTPFFQFARHIDQHIQGKCAGCEHHQICVGCRGNAFCVGRAEGLGIYQAVSREDPACQK